MSKAIINAFKGAAIGIGSAICLFIVGFCIEVLNLGCAILTCDCDKPTVFDWSGMWSLLAICTIAGAVIGCVMASIRQSRTVMLKQPGAKQRVLKKLVNKE